MILCRDLHEDPEVRGFDGLEPGFNDSRASLVQVKHPNKHWITLFFDLFNLDNELLHVLLQHLSHLWPIYLSVKSLRVVAYLLL